jgi:hypothetical protein
LPEQLQNNHAASLHHFSGVYTASSPLARMLCKIERQRDEKEILLSRSEYVESADIANGLVADIDSVVESLRDSLWLLNVFIHDNPELAFEEYKAHDVLTEYMQSHDTWQVTRSAHGLATAWVAVHDSGSPGPVVSFNAEMGASSTLLERTKDPS